MRMDATTQGLSELIARMRAAPEAVNLATRSATIAGSQIAVAEVRSNLRGSPRWGHRGRSRIYREGITVSSAKGDGGSGPPGKLSGDLLRGVGYKRVPVTRGGIVVGGVGIGKTVNNLKKRYLEENFPFFHSSIEAVEHDIFAVYEHAWAEALRRIMG